MENKSTDKSKQKKRLRGLNLSLVIMTVVPFIVVGLFLGIFMTRNFKKIILREINEDLKHTALIVKYTLDFAYEGDLEPVGNGHVAIVKGEKVLSGDYSLIDSIKEDTGTEVTIFYENTRVVTTILNRDENRMIGTTISDVVVDRVIKNNKDAFYDNISIDKKSYCGYYMPIHNADGVNVGMIAILKPLDVVNKKIADEMRGLMIVLFMGLVLMAFISFRYANRLIARIHKIQAFIVKISNGDFRVRLDERVFHKKDEISDIGRSAEKMQSSLRKLIELDALTEINNRRFGDKMLEEAHARLVGKGEKFSVALADIDFFKKVNDTYGHQCGDLVLKEMAAIFRKHMLGKGFVARWGGEEFLMVFEDADMETAYKTMLKIVDEIRAKEITFNDQTLSVTITCGMAEGSEQNVNMIVREADDKLYKGKQNGRNQIVM